MENEVIREETVRPVRLPQIFKRISWGGVWAGVMIALGMEALLTFFGLWIGFRMYNWQSANPWGGIASWSTVWYFVTAAWSMFFGAWCAARLSGYPTRGTGILNGITVWGLATVATMMALSLGSWSVLREGINVLASGMVTVTSTAPGVLPHAAPPQPADQVAQATTHAISAIAFRAWIGMIIGLLTSILGGAIGHASSFVAGTRETPVAPRIAA